MTRRLGLNFIAALCACRRRWARPLLPTRRSPMRPCAAIATACATLLQEGADVSAAQGDGMTALHWAAERGDAELTGHADLRRRQRRGGDAHRPVHAAAPRRAHGNAAVVEALLKAGASVHAKTTKTGATPLHLAARLGQRRHHHGAPRQGRRRQRQGVGVGPDAADLRRGEQPRRRRSACSCSAAPTPTSRPRPSISAAASALDRAARDRAGQDPRGRRAEGTEGRPPARSRRAIQAARELLLSGQAAAARSEPAAAGGGGGRDPNFNPEEINPPVTTKGGLTALLHAARQGYVEAVAALLDGGADVNAVGGDDTSALLIAVINGQFDVAMLLLERGADPERRREEQRRHAALGGHQHAVAAADALPAAAGDGAAEGHLPRRHGRAAREAAPIRTRGSSRIPGSWSTPAAATATAALPTRPARPRSGARPTRPTSTR